MSTSLQMAYNSYKEWTDTEIRVLEMCLREGKELKEIARMLGRTQRAVTHAIRHVLIQQSMRYGSKEVAEYHHIRHDRLCDKIVPAKYNVPIDNDGGDTKVCCMYAMFILAHVAIITGGVALFG